MMTTRFARPGLILMLTGPATLLLAACGAMASPPGTGVEAVSAEPSATARHAGFRVRYAVDAPLEADRGWAGVRDEDVTVRADEPFRLRFRIHADEAPAGPFRLQARRNGGAWETLVARDFPYPDETSTPRVSIVEADGYETGEVTRDLLGGPGAPFRGGSGVSLDSVAPAQWSGGAGYGEYEWPVVIRRWADGPVTNEEDDVFDFRMVDASGHPLPGGPLPRLRLEVPPGLLGGTFVETPGRIGPWQAWNGDLYFVMEPAETDNVLMVVRSRDGGVTWDEVDGAHRPATDDLEGFGTALHDGRIHMLHQTSDAVWYHAFGTADDPEHPNRWVVRDERIASPPKPPTQVATLVARSDGSLVALYGHGTSLAYRVRSAAGQWGEEDAHPASRDTALSGPQAVVGTGGRVHFAYTAFTPSGGEVRLRTLDPDGTLSPPVVVADRIETGEEAVGAVAPLVYLPETGAVVVLYRTADGLLRDRRLLADGSLTEPVTVSDRRVVMNAVDSDQVGADAIGDGDVVHVLFIDERTRDLYHVRSPAAGEWSTARPVVTGIDGQWVRGTRVMPTLGEAVYGFVYDAGSDGGSGMNRYGEVGLKPYDVAAAEPRWLPGDHHIHSRHSVDDDETTDPPSPIIGGDSPYSTSMNAIMAQHHGLAWMVTTDHGGPNHSKVNLERAYPDLLRSRVEVPGLIQFYGMEFDTPGAGHSSLIIPHSDHEHTHLHRIESRFNKQEPWPEDPLWDTEPRMVEALEYMARDSVPPVVIANHPSRSATALGEYGRVDPAELRDWNDAAPEVAVGMEGAPGHQASALLPDGRLDPEGDRGGYDDHPTHGGFDQMTARLGGFWDSMLGEGRRWWITSTSDSHVHWRQGGSDFWPGEYSKTYVHAAPTYAGIIEGIRAGRVFVTTGDLISRLDVTATTAPDAAFREGADSAAIGGTLLVPAGSDVRVTIRVRDPAGVNFGGRSPEVARVDLIMGDVTGPIADRMTDTNPTTRVVRRFTAADWSRDGEVLTMTHTLRDVHHTSYLRVRGTNTSELEPEPDPWGEDPWGDLWFYSNPVFLGVR